MRYLRAYGAGLLVLALIAAPTASAKPFHRGDVFVKGERGIEEYWPNGTPLRLIEGTASGGGPYSVGAGFCFDPSGNYLIVPGAGLFDKQGRMLPSNWASDRPGRDCVVDALGDVFVPSAFPDPPTVTKYDIQGNLLQSFNVLASGFDPALALGPDGCTIYYAGDESPGIGRFNVCTNTQESVFREEQLEEFQELRVLPNWEVLTLFTTGAARYDTSGQFVRWYDLPVPPARIYNHNFDNMAVDPDGTSFWICCSEQEAYRGPKGEILRREEALLRFDISSGELLARWSPIPGSSSYYPSERGPIAVYSPDNNGRGAG